VSTFAVRVTSRDFTKTSSNFSVASSRARESTITGGVEGRCIRWRWSCSPRGTSSGGGNAARARTGSNETVCSNSGRELYFNLKCLYKIAYRARSASEIPAQIETVGIAGSPGILFLLAPSSAGTTRSPRRPPSLLLARTEPPRPPVRAGGQPRWQLSVRPLPPTVGANRSPRLCRRSSVDD
jgi:hypothetical protein